MAPYGLPSHTRDSLELASLASSSQGNEDGVSEMSSRPSISSSRRLSLEQDDPLDSANPAGRMHRSYSVSSAFDFAANMFPLSSTAGAGGYAPIGAPTSTARPNGGLGGGSLEKHKTLTYLNGLSLIVGLIIGSGIFSSPGSVSTRVGSPGAALVVWVIAGVLAWTGAASYAELGGAIPLNGGAQVYLAKTFGELSGFLFTWVAMLVLKPGSAAIIAIIEKQAKQRRESISAFTQAGRTDSAAPPLASPSSFVRITPVTSRSSWNDFATLTASCPVMASTTSRISVG